MNVESTSLNNCREGEDVSGTVITRARRLAFAYAISLALLIATVLVGYAILRDVIATQNQLLQFKSDVNSIHLALSDSTPVVSDLRAQQQNREPDPRIAQLLIKRVVVTINDIEHHKNSLLNTASALRRTNAWNDIQWVTDSRSGALHYKLDNYLNQLALIAEWEWNSATDSSVPMNPVDAASAPGATLVTGYQRASDQLALLIYEHSARSELIYLLLTVIVVIFALLLSLLFVAPLWRGMVRSHRKLQSTHATLRQLAYVDKDTGLPNLHGLALEATTPCQSDGMSNAPYLLLIRIKNIDDIYNLVGSQSGSEIHALFASKLETLPLDVGQWSRGSEAEYVALLSYGAVARSKDWMGDVYASLIEPLLFNGIFVRPEVSLAVADTAQGVSTLSKSAGQRTLLEYQVRARMASQLFEPAVCDLPIYEVALKEKLLDDNELLADISKAVEAGEFVPHYQIKVDALTGQPSSLEALCRWSRSDGTTAYPESFILSAEKSGFIVPITYQLLDLVVRDITQWSERGIAVGTVSINVSADVLLHGELLERLRQSLSRLPDNCSGLEIEVTENVALCENHQRIKAMLYAIRELGVRVSVDDFGTGYASLQTLMEFPYDVLKIDKSFVDQMREDGSGFEVVTAMLSLANNLNKPCVVEGIELKWQWEQLADMGADELQGFFFYKPTHAEDTYQQLRISRSEKRSVQGTVSAFRRKPFTGDKAKLVSVKPV